MDLIVKAFSSEPKQTTRSKRYQLFTSKIVKDVNDKDVEIPISIGDHSIESLNNERDELVRRISDIDEKISAIQDKQSKDQDEN